MDPTNLPQPGAVGTWGEDPLVVAVNLEGPGGAEPVLRQLLAALPGSPSLLSCQ